MITGGKRETGRETDPEADAGPGGSVVTHRITDANRDLAIGFFGSV